MPQFQLSEDTLGYSDSDSDSDSDHDSAEEIEPPHPLGFNGEFDPSSPWGKTWISLDPPPPSQYSKGRSTYALDEEEDLFVQSYPPISTYLSSDHVSTTALLRFGKETGPISPQLYHRQRWRETDDDLYYSSGDEEGSEEQKENFYGQMLQEHPQQDNDYDDYATEETNDVELLLQHSYKPSTPLLQNSPTPSFASPQEVRSRRDETNRRIQRRVEAERRRIDEECNRTAAILGKLILQSTKEADVILQKRKAEEDRLAKAQHAREEQERKLREKTEKEAALRQKLADKEASEQQEAAKKQKEKEQALQAANEKKRQEAEARAKRKTEHIDKAKKLVGQLVQLRASVEPFEKNKAVGKRRLGMKKIAKGKVNTLNDNPGKIAEVAAEISQAITRYDQEDAQIKQQLQQKVAEVTPDMAVGRRYFVDLLASTAMTRVQAESFSGTKGDGFPLSAMLAMVSVENKNILAVLAAHIYTVCPTAIPTLPTPKADASEDEVMTGLGMQRNKKTGEFESFPQFLARTENIISFMAAIQSSLPSSHQLLAGNTGALLWLKRFLDLLPPAPTSPLPLITAPVLGAFLTGAGHMLANVHADNFRKLLGKIESDIVNRLDEGEIGKPSAIRLTKVLEGGFDGFLKNLPAKAIPDLYCGFSEHSKKKEVVTSFGGTIGGDDEQVQAKRDPPAQAPNPFGGGGGAASGFGGSSNNNNNPSPFGQPSGNNNNPFGGGNNNQSPFGGGAAAPAPSPFGGTAGGFGGAPAPSPFGGPPAPSPSPFGAAPSPSPFGGGGAAPSPSPFGGGAAPSPSPFGAAPSPSPFGGGAAPSPSPFGSGAALSPSPFSGGAAPSPSPFGGPAAPSPSPFGGGAAPSPSPFGAAPSPSPFGGGAAPSPSPFGGPAAPSPSPFGGAAPSPSPFGGGATSSPFGGGAAPSPSPFGGNNNFGSNPSPFGGGNTMQQNSPFGGGNNQKNPPFGGGGKKKGPCKFFQQGKCRNGANCQYSHDINPSGGGGGFGNQGFQSKANAPFGSNNNNGGGRNNQGFGSNNNNGGGRNNQGFGSNNNNSGFGGGNNNSGFGGGNKKGPCKFFAQGRCKKGKNCPFSHDLGGGNGGFGGGNNSNWNSFGGPRR